MKYTIKKTAPTVTYYKFEEKNQKQETLLIEIMECERGNHNKKKFPEKWLSIDTYVTDSEGNCRGAYNPTVEPYEYGYKLKDDMILEATEENVIKLLQMTYNLFMSATGKSATETKLEKINQFAKENNLEIYTNIPEGWKESYCASYPKGCSRITNGKRFFNRAEDGKIVRNKEYKEAIYIF